jgi:photosystem II stability/assembly factor-like uncharacterized protein
MPANKDTDNQDSQKRLIAAKSVFVRLLCARGAAEADKKGLKMTAAFGLRTCALVLCIVMAVRAQPVPDTTLRAVSSPAWNDACSLSIRGAVVRWAVGDSGKVLKTVDGDTTAEYTVGRGQYDLCGVSFADENHGWVVGSKRDEPNRGRGVVLSTRRGGNGTTEWVWSCPVVRPEVNVPFVKVQALSVRHVWVTCGDGYMLYTNDGGARWAVTAKRPGFGESGTSGSNHEE